MILLVYKVSLRQLSPKKSSVFFTSWGLILHPLSVVGFWPFSCVEMFWFCLFTKEFGFLEVARSGLYCQCSVEEEHQLYGRVS